jgi:hypothetical protein
MRVEGVDCLFAAGQEGCAGSRRHAGELGCRHPAGCFWSDRRKVDTAILLWLDELDQDAAL